MNLHGPLGYPVFVATGLGLAAFASRWLGNPSGLPGRTRSRLMLAAAAGAVLGAYLLQLPADLLGLSPPGPTGSGDHLPLGGRTVLGGLLGGLAAVEWAKARLHVRRSTGAQFGLPLALALGCGRLGCLCAGCCAGQECAPTWWATVDAAGVSRLPVQGVEALFHFGAAAWFAWRASRRADQPDRGAGFAAYLAAYGVLRFLLEFWRQHPVWFWGVTYHQVLALLLAAVGISLWRRRRRTP